MPIPLSDQILNSDIWGKDFVFEANKRYFLEAASGKGKTTLQHILYGLRKDYTGNVTVNIKSNSTPTSIIKPDLQEDLSSTHSLMDLTLSQWADIRQRELSVIFQDLRLFLQLTAMQNIQLKNDLTNYKTDDQIFSMAKDLNVFDLLDKQCGKMSYGQRQRIAIIRALCQPFRFLILDEPFSHLDSGNIHKCCKLISRECQSQKAGYAIVSLEEKYFLEYDIEIKI